MSEIYSSETEAAMRRDIAAWQERKDAARDALIALSSDLLDEGVLPLQLGQILNGFVMYGFRHKDGRWFGWDHGPYRTLDHKPDQDKPAASAAVVSSPDPVEKGTT